MAKENRDRNSVQKYVLLIGVFALAALIGSYWMGWGLTIGLLVIGATVTSYSLNRAPERMLRWQGAEKISRYYNGGLYEMANQLASRAGLGYSPELYLVRNRVPNAFALGTRDRPIIGMTSGLVNMLTERELAGVLAHEISHIRNNDLFVKGVALSFGNLTNTLSFVGRVMLLFAVPMMLMGIEVFPFLAVLALIFSPMLNVLLQMGLSRTMEFLADHDAAEITRDPMGLASALHKIDSRSRRWWQAFNPTVYSAADWLKSHPDTKKRIARLQEMIPSRGGTHSGDTVERLGHPLFARRSAWI